jgi:AcrR family transcriptional regulator
MSKSNQKNTRQRILEAALERFAQDGYYDTSMDDIVRQANTSKGGIYFHFPSKEEIFLGLVDEFANILENRLDAALAEEESGVQRVNTALNVCVETFNKYKKLAKIFLIQAFGLGNAFEEKRRQIHQRFIEIIQRHLDEAVEEGSIEPIDTQITAYAWMGGINEVVIAWVLTGEPDPAEALPTLRTILLRGIGVEEDKIQQLDA